MNVKKLINIYRFLFGRIMFYKLNRFLFDLSLKGLGILNYENDTISGEKNFLKNFLKNKKNPIIFDVGANRGSYSKAILSYSNSVKIYAFEPHPANFEKLKGSIKHNDFNCYNFAAGEHDAYSYLYDYAEKDGSCHASVYKDVIERIHKEASVKHKIKIIRLCDFVKEKGIASIDLLKIDVEGNELNVLKGLSQYISEGKIKTIHFEFNEMNVSSRVYFKDFWEILPNYDFYRMLPDGLASLKVYNSAFCEIFAYQNIVAILKSEKI